MDDMTNCIPLVVPARQLQPDQNVESELLEAVRAASRCFHHAKGEADAASARDKYFQALAAFSDFLFGRARA
jgi:hypothetical protein